LGVDQTRGDHVGTLAFHPALLLRDFRSPNLGARLGGFQNVLVNTFGLLGAGRQIMKLMKRLLSSCAAALAFISGSAAQDEVAKEIAPDGRLRGAVIGIKVLGGIGEPIGRFIAGKLGATFEPVIYPNPQAYEASFGKGEWDIALGPRVLAPADKADVTPDVWLIELLYLAAAGHEFASSADVDRAGIKVGTIQNSPSDRILTRILKSAELVRLPLSANFPADAIELLRSGKANVFGADSGLIAAIAGGYPEAKVVPGTFSIVRAAIAVPKGRSSVAQAKLLDLVNEAKKTGVVENAFEQAGLKSGVRVAPE
jgi:polar amino acid transport system substrate-binding protein